MLGVYVLTRILYTIVNFRLTRVQESVLAFVIGVCLSIGFQYYPNLFGFTVWFILDVTGVTNNHERRRKRLLKRQNKSINKKGIEK